LIEADFQHRYQMDLRVAVREEPARRLTALVLGLPPDSALRLALAEGQIDVPELPEVERPNTYRDPKDIRAFLAGGQVNDGG
jgi:hypothetical protein